MKSMQPLSCLVLTSIVLGYSATGTTQDADDIIIEIQPGVTEKEVQHIVAKYPRFKIGHRVKYQTIINQ